MHPHLIEQIARQRHAELATVTWQARQARLAGKPKHSRRSLRSHTGWAIVGIGLRIATGGNHPPLAPGHSR